MSQKIENDRKIESALKRLVEAKDRALQESLVETSAEAMDYAMEIHDADDTHRMHIAVDSHYGWLVRHNGDTVDSALHRGSVEGGFAGAAIEQMAEDLPDGNWEGIVVAGMGPGYDPNFEVDVIEDLVTEAHTDFPENLKAKFRLR